MVFKTRYWDIYESMGLTLLLSAKSVSLFFFSVYAFQNLITKKATKAYKYHATSQFIDDLFVRNNDDEF